MHRFAVFVDGSNLFGSLKVMNLEVDDYEAFFGYVYREAEAMWKRVCHVTGQHSCELRRVYWYVVGAMDRWDLSLPQSQTALRKAFDADADARNAWLARTGKADPSLSGAKLHDKAWADCFTDFRVWYEKKMQILDNMHRFHQAIRIGTDLIDIVEAGHWKVNFIHKYLEEKGLDTSLAVDMIAYDINYDIALVVSGDADSIPSIRFVKTKNKLIGAVEFVNGSPPEAKGRNFSSRLKEHADFVVRIYESELVRHKLARRPNPHGASAA